MYQTLHERVPPCIVSAVFRSHWNDWCCARRFQDSSTGRCRLDERCNGEDSIEHYSACASVWEFAGRRLRLCRSSCCLQSFLLLDQMTEQETICMALLVYAVISGVNDLRVRQTKAEHGAAEGILFERVRKACMLHDFCANVVNSLWSSNSSQSDRREVPDTRVRLTEVQGSKTECPKTSSPDLKPKDICNLLS